MAGRIEKKNAKQQSNFEYLDFNGSRWYSLGSVSVIIVVNRLLLNHYNFFIRSCNGRTCCHFPNQTIDPISLEPWNHKFRLNIHHHLPRRNTWRNGMGPPIRFPRPWKGLPSHIPINVHILFNSTVLHELRNVLLVEILSGICYWRWIECRLCLLYWMRPAPKPQFQKRIHHIHRHYRR